jgi:hypothetical protein
MKIREILLLNEQELSGSTRPVTADLLQWLLAQIRPLERSQEFPDGTRSGHGGIAVHPPDASGTESPPQVGLKPSVPPQWEWTR